jgi:hypothetical protein
MAVVEAPFDHSEAVGKATLADVAIHFEDVATTAGDRDHTALQEATSTGVTPTADDQMTGIEGAAGATQAPATIQVPQQVWSSGGSTPQRTFDSRPYLNLRSSLDRWKEIGADSLVLRIIEKGVKLTLTKRPAPHRGQHHIDQHSRVMLQDLEQRGIVRPLTNAEVQSTRVWTPVFSVPKKDSDKWRLITDLRNLNSTMLKPNFKQDSWKTVTHLLTSECPNYATKIDIKDFFFNLGLDKSSQRWIRVRDGDKGWQFTCLPFGLLSSPYWSHRVAKVVIAHCRNMGIKLVWYVDDILLVSQDQETLTKNTKYLVELLESLGYEVNRSKSVLEPVQSIEYLGLNLNLNSKTISIDQKKTKNLIQLTQHLLRGTKTTASLIASLAGKLLYLANGWLVLRGFARSLMREAGRLSQTSWVRFLVKPENLKTILRDLLTVLRTPKELPWPTSKTEFKLETDASEMGWAARLTTPWKETFETQGRFTKEESKWHIGDLETITIKFGLLAFWNHLSDESSINVVSDSNTAIAVWSKASPVHRLNSIVRDTLQRLSDRRITLTTWYVRSKENPMDAPSRNFIEDPYLLSPSTFRFLQRRFNVQMEIDCFASRSNTHLRKFWSWMPDPDALARNAFNQDWKEKMLYMFPPPNLIPAVIHKLKRDRATGVLVFPLWKTAIWWPNLQEIVISSTLLRPQAIQPFRRWRWCAALVRV